jgi:8-oxo-dGTP pyrophosphatase MutT (NUDIX family)
LVTSEAPQDLPDGPTPASRLGADWVQGDDGLRFRRAARVILLDPADRLLLIRGHDIDQPGRSWWFTVGGGIDAGEDARTAAVREVREETGLALDPADLVGPVFTRSAVFDFFAETCRQDEEIFVARVAGPDLDPEALRRDGWTELEVDVLDEVRWWDLDALRQVTEEVFPEGLPDLVSGLLPQWDGVTRHL